MPSPAPDAERTAMACAALADTPDAVAAVAAKAALEPNGTATRCSPAGRRLAANAPSRVTAPEVSDAPDAPADPITVALVRPSVGLNHPVGATGSAGTNGEPALPALSD